MEKAPSVKTHETKLMQGSCNTSIDIDNSFVARAKASCSDRLAVQKGAATPNKADSQNL